jgi:hypothetical protein
MTIVLCQLSKSRFSRFSFLLSLYGSSPIFMRSYL